MIRGIVNAQLEAVVILRVRGPRGIVLDLEAIIDSGFTASLTLPVATIAVLGLARQSGGEATMADGTVRHFEIYAAEVSWDGAWRQVLVSDIGAEVLVGMHLLAGSDLTMSVVAGGSVEITAIT